MTKVMKMRMVAINNYSGSRSNLVSEFRHAHCIVVAPILQLDTARDGVATKVHLAWIQVARCTRRANCCNLGDAFTLQLSTLNSEY